ncbi:MAG: N-acetylmuramoyl-L-alanine amidase [Akkermansiaceae bacterium]|nr:N-acetylmuramoyl-L-alanine amidase [Akkermansiaceae bacterium]
MRNPAPIIATLMLGALIAFLLIRQEKPSPPQPQPPAPAPPAPSPPSPALSFLAEAPDWTALDAFQHTITRSDFERLLTQIFTTDETWRQYITFNEGSAEILTTTDPAEPPFSLHFATSEKKLPAPRTWQPTHTRPIPQPGKTLANHHIAIDPGHIGGDWAKIEERWFKIGTDKPVTEGDMTLQVAKILQPLLEEMGAQVTLVRSTTEPVTPLRPENLASVAEESAPSDPDSLRKFAEKLFYRTAEIRARANLVNQTIKPDLVLCLHFNAEAWGDPAQPSLVPRSHFHILLNGAYTGDEVRLADQRFAMLEKLLQRTHEEEALIGQTVAATFAKISKLPPYIYPADGNNVRPVNANHFLWARNLLANRLYDCPVIYMEPYVMNSTIDYPRFQAGNYQGTKQINNQQLPSIFQEYANGLAQGLANHYSTTER